MNPEPWLAIIILNTNRRDDTLACLQSLKENSYQNQYVLVLDNNSTDGSVPAIQEGFPNVQIINLSENLGYAGNNNVGIQAAMDTTTTEWILVLNEDTVLAPDCLETLAKAGSNNPKIGVVGPMVYHHDEPGVIQSAGGQMDRFWQARHHGENQTDQNQYPAPRKVDWISGCAIMVRRPVIDKIGSLDERFFYYWEETEWCLRARLAGWEIQHIPEAKLWHKGVQQDYRPSPSITYYSTRNKLLLMAKHKAPLAVWIYTWSQIFRTLFSWTIRPKWRSKRDHRTAMVQGALDFLRRRWGMRPA